MIAPLLSHPCARPKTREALLADFPYSVQQGIGWVIRKAIGLATLTLTVKQYVDDKGDTHIDIDQTATGGIKGTSEHRTLNWGELEHTDHIFGTVKGRSRYVPLSEVTDDFLKKGWLPEMSEGDAKMIQSYVESVGGGWTADQIWGFEEVNGERRYTRHALVKKGDQFQTARLVYDWVE